MFLSISTKGIKSNNKEIAVDIPKKELEFFFQSLKILLLFLQNIMIQNLYILLLTFF